MNTAEQSGGSPVGHQGEVNPVGMMAKPQQYCTFRLGEQRMGIDVRAVQEVLRFQEVTRVPLAPEVVSGLINVRGRIVMAIDLRRRFRLPAPAADWQPTSIILHHEEASVSLLVDEVCDVLHVEETTRKPIPDTLNAIAREFVAGVHDLEDGLLLILDMARIQDLETLTRSPALHRAVPSTSDG